MVFLHSCETRLGKSKQNYINKKPPVSEWCFVQLFNLVRGIDIKFVLTAWIYLIN